MSSEPEGIGCHILEGLAQTEETECEGLFVSDVEVVLTALPASGSAFFGWEGDCEGTLTTCTLVLDENRTVTARFEPVEEPEDAETAAMELHGQNTLTPGQLLLMDQLGNNNGVYDLGDFPAYLDRTGQGISAELMQRLLREAGGAHERRHTPEGNTMRRPIWTLLTAVLVVAGGCDGSSPTDPPDNGTPQVPGWLTLELSSPHDYDGGILFTVSGGPIEEVEPLIDGFFTAAEQEGTWTVLSTATFTDGAVARIFVPDVQAAAGLHAAIQQAAARETYMQRDVSEYALTIVP